MWQRRAIPGSYQRKGPGLRLTGLLQRGAEGGSVNDRVDLTRDDLEPGRVEATRTAPTPDSVRRVDDEAEAVRDVTASAAARSGLHDDRVPAQRQEARPLRRGLRRVVVLA